ncbi:hypothetical protein [Halorubrum lipolyticum]|uniref:hypothetical protein n=1 Tax=Halorubrum lipolyticum TaxID=368624 RepID=UPI0011C98FDE|nr:hypothetical protein [Halorubrum lipolyticum]
MKRRELLGTFSAGGVAVSAGCLSRTSAAADCSPFSRFGIVIENVRSTPQSLQLSIRTGILERDVFSSEFDVPTAEDSPPPWDHPEGVYRKNVLPNMRSLIATVSYEGERLTHSWLVSCNHLYIRLRDNGDVTFTTISPDLFDSMASDLD